MLRDILEIQRYAHTVCKSASVKADKNFKASFTNTRYPKTYERGNTIYIELPQPTMKTTEEEYVLHRHFVIHEILHHTEGPDVGKVWKDNKIPTKNDDPLNNLCMAAEDYRIEHTGSTKYKGDAKSINEANGIIVQRFIDMISKMSPEELQQFHDDKYSAGILAAMLADVEARVTWCPSTLNGNLEVLKNTVPTPVLDSLHKLNNINYGDKLLAAKTEQDAIDVAKEAFKVLYDEDADDHCDQQAQQQVQQQQGEGEQEQEQAQGDSSESGNNQDEGGNQESKAQEESNSEEGEGKGTPTEGFSDSGKKVKYNKLLLSSHNLENGSGSGINWQYDSKDFTSGTNFEPTPLDKIRVTDFSKEDLSSKTTQSLPSDIEDKVSRGFANKVRRLIQIKSQARYIGGQTRGKINRKQLYRVGCPTVGNGDWNSKVFKRRYQDDVLDVTIQLLVDSSGSMSGRKYQTAIQAAIMLNKAFEQVLHIPVEVLTFTESSGSKTAMGIIKKAGARLTKDKMINNFMQFYYKYAGCNSDGEAIQFAAMRLRKAPTKRKIMIVLSDGSPASSRPGSETVYTKKTIEEIIKQKEIEIYGIGIKNDSVQHFYPEFQVITDVNELERAILSVIKKKLVV